MSGVAHDEKRGPWNEERCERSQDDVWSSRKRRQTELNDGALSKRGECVVNGNERGAPLGERQIDRSPGGGLELRFECAETVKVVEGTSGAPRRFEPSIDRTREWRETERHIADVIR